MKHCFAKKPILLFATLLSVVAISSSVRPQTGVKTSELRILFIGNSLTAANDLPDILTTIAKENDRKIKTKMVAFPDFSLDDHLKDGAALKEIRDGHWNFVVMQQGSSALPESRVELVASAKLFATEIKARGATPAFFMVWPSEQRRFDFTNVHDSYALAAKETASLFIPAGDSWIEAWKEDPKTVLYSDAVHPTPLGSVFAAAVIYIRLTKATSVEIPTRFAFGKLSPAEIDLIRKVAMRVAHD